MRHWLERQAVKMVYLGIDIGGTAVKYGIVTDRGAVIYRNEYSVAFDGYRTPILDTVLKTSRIFVAEYRNVAGPAAEPPAGIGVSATGQIDAVHGVVAGVGGNVENWKGSRIKEALEAAFHLPVTVLNDADCAALAEVWAGTAKGCKNVVMITIGTGVGGGLIVDGRILLGHSGFAGELGHFMLEKGGRPCTCGNRGCYEQYASMTALVRMVREALPIAGYPEITAEAVNGRLIFELMECGEPVVSGLAGQWIQDIAAGLVSFAHLFNPELILLGGGVSVQEQLFIEPVRKLVKEHAMENFSKDLRVERAGLGNDAGVVGGVAYLRSDSPAFRNSLGCTPV